MQLGVSEHVHNAVEGQHCPLPGFLIVPNRNPVPPTPGPAKRHPARLQESASSATLTSGESHELCPFSPGVLHSRNVLKVCLGCSTEQNLIPFYDCTHMYIDIHHFLIKVTLL